MLSVYRVDHTSRNARDRPGIQLNVPRPGQTHSGTMMGPGIAYNFVHSCNVILIDS